MTTRCAATPRRIGVTGDTHDLVRPELLAALDGVELILHTGDVCSPTVLEALAAVAPVLAVRGNNDVGDWAADLPEQRSVRIDGVHIYMLHARQDLTSAPPPPGTDLMLFGHSHRPDQGVINGIAWLNPGSPGRRRFSLPVTCALLEINGRAMHHHHIDLLQTPM